MPASLARFSETHADLLDFLGNSRLFRSRGGFIHAASLAKCNYANISVGRRDHFLFLSLLRSLASFLSASPLILSLFSPISLPSPSPSLSPYYLPLLLFHPPPALSFFLCVFLRRSALNESQARLDEEVQRARDKGEKILRSVRSLSFPVCLCTVGVE